MIIQSPYDEVELASVPLHDFVLAGAVPEAEGVQGGHGVQGGQGVGRGDRAALIDGLTGRVLTYAELGRSVRRAAAGLAARGLARGDTLALCSPNSPEFAVAYYAALAAGALVTTVNPLAPAEDMARQLSHSGARWLVTTAPLAQGSVGEAAAAAGVRETFAVGPADATGRAIPFTWLTDTDHPDRLPVVSPDDDAVLLYSSGTTGRPKGVLLSHRSLVASLCQTRAVHRVGPDDVVLTVLPLYHIYALQLTLSLGLAAGATVVTMPRFDLDGCCAMIQDYGVTRVEVVPPIVLALARHPAVTGYDLSSLRLITSGAASLGATVAAECAQRLGCRVKQAYGMTEFGGATHSVPDTGGGPAESVGPLLPGAEARVVDCVSGLDVGPGQPGELLIRTPGTMRGYLADPQATAATIDADGWLHTGDVAVADREGWFQLVDRVKELIKYKGSQVSPAALEDILVAHPAVADAAVIGRPDVEAGEIPTAVIVPRQPAADSGPLGRELRAYVAERVAPHEKIRRVEFVSEIPRSPSGKILRRQLATPAASAARLDGTVSVITGGGQGIGRVLALALADAGAAVGLIARSGTELAETVRFVTASGGTAAAACADISDQHATAGAIDALRRQLGPVDLLVNNAGVSGPFGDAWQVDAEDWWRAVEINLRGVFLCSRAVLPAMTARGTGRIVNITSEAGVFRWPQVSAYSVSKAAVIKFTENLAAEASQSGVRVFSVHPGITPIGLSERALADAAPPGSAQARIFAWVRGELRAGRGADPALVARLVIRLAAGDADPLSGCHLSVRDDLDAILARGPGVQDRYQLRLASRRPGEGDRKDAPEFVRHNAF